MIWDVQHIHHQLMMFNDHVVQSAATIRSKCHPFVLALMFCTTERCTYFHIGRKACVWNQMKQWLVSWDLHHISTSTDDV